MSSTPASNNSLLQGQIVWWGGKDRRGCEEAVESGPKDALIKMLGFVAAMPVAASGRASSSTVCRRPRYAPAMRAEGSSKKKAAALIFAQDMKGKAVWSLRAARQDDVDALVALGGDVGRMGAAVLSAMVDGGDGACVVCEASVKGTKAGEGYAGKVLGASLADVTAAVRDPEVGFESGLVKRAEFLACNVAKTMQDPEEVRKTLLLASLKKLKGAEVATATKNVADGDDAELKLFKDIGFKVAQQSVPASKGSKSKCTVLSASLATINPDPKKRFS